MRRILTRLPLLVAAGCSCSDQTFVAQTWEDNADDYGKWLSMGVSPNGDPVMAYYDVTAGGVGFAIGDLQSDGAVRWKHEEVDGFADSSGLDPGDLGQFTSLAVAPDGTTWIAYYARGALKVAHRVDGIWSSEVAASGTGLHPDMGQWASLALDGDANPVVAHYDADGGTLQVSRFDGAAWSTEEAAVGLPYDGLDAAGAPVHREANVGMYANLLIQDSTEYIAYYDAAQQDLRFLEGFAGAYTASTIYHAEGGNVGQWPSLWTDGTRIRVAFEDRGNGDLLVAKREGAGSFETDVAVQGDFAGSDAEIFERNGAMAVAYFDGRTNDMKLATEGESGWSAETLGGADAAVGFFNEVVTTGGKQFAASYDYTNHTLFWKPLD